MATNRLEVPVLLVFCVAVWVSIQHLGYIEFDTAGRLLLAGSFQKLLRSHISLRKFEADLASAKTPDECWSVLRNQYHEFGFYEIHVKLADREYHDRKLSLEAPDIWRLEIPLSGNDFIYLARAFEVAALQNAVVPFTDSLRRILGAKAGSFAPLPRPPQLAVPILEAVRYRVASAGK
jgi:hypothetical protein